MIRTFVCMVLVGLTPFSLTACGASDSTNDAPAKGANVFPATIEVVTYLGSTSELILRLTSSETVIVTKPASAAAPQHWTPGQSLFIRVDPASAVGIAPM